MNNLQAMLVLVNGKPLAELSGHPDTALKYIYYDRYDDLIKNNKGEPVNFEQRAVSEWTIFQETKAERAARDKRDYEAYQAILERRKAMAFDFEGAFNSAIERKKQ